MGNPRVSPELEVQAILYHFAKGSTAATSAGISCDGFNGIMVTLSVNGIDRGGSLMWMASFRMP